MVSIVCRKYARGLALSLAIPLVGCSSKAARVYPPDFEAAEAAAAAMEEYDADGNGSLSDEELQGCPGIGENITFYDKDKDGQVSALELEGRLNSWLGSNVGCVARKALVTLDGKPLKGAIVCLEAEDFLGDGVRPAGGETTSRGLVRIRVDTSEGGRPLPGIQPGIYKVTVTHPTIDILPRYNTETMLGCEGAPDRPYETFLRFEMKSR